MVDYGSLFNAQPSYAVLAEAFDHVEADVTYIDDTETVIYFSPFRIFERPASCLNQPVYGCHAPATKAIIDEMLTAFRDGSKDKVSYETTNNDRLIRVCYQAARTPEGAYLGCLEAVSYRD